MSFNINIKHELEQSNRQVNKKFKPSIYIVILRIYFGMSLISFIMDN